MINVLYSEKTPVFSINDTRNIIYIISPKTANVGLLYVVYNIENHEAFQSPNIAYMYHKPLYLLTFEEMGQ